MQTILVAGAGKSSIYLIQYLLSHASKNKWKVIVADGSAEAIAEKTGNSPYAEAAVMDITDAAQREPLVKQADIIVSLMPPHLHIHLAKDCLKHKKNLVTSSYISPAMKEMDKAVKEAGLMFMCEMGLDPGIDHMTASHIIHSTQKVAATITSFKSYCGGVLAPESDDNPWHYKFTWNPHNIITAGAGGAHYLYNGKEVKVPYEQLFENNKKIKVNGLSPLAYYPNRDSLHYLSLYEVPDITTFIRATLRHPDFCKGWDAIIQLGLTSEQDSFDTSGYTYHTWLKYKTACNDSTPLKEHVATLLQIKQDDKIMSMLEWLELFEDTPLSGKTMSSAEILLGLLLGKWAMKPEDKDMVVMQHDVEYLHKNKKVKLVSSMVLIGENREHSAMAKTVGLPMAILARMVLENKITPPAGVLIPSMPAVYKPVLAELSQHGITFTEEVS